MGEETTILAGVMDSFGLEQVSWTFVDELLQEWVLFVGERI